MNLYMVHICLVFHGNCCVWQTLLPVMLSHLPAGCSVGQFRHYFQSHAFGKYSSEFCGFPFHSQRSAWFFYMSPTFLHKTVYRVKYREPDWFDQTHLKFRSGNQSVTVKSPFLVGVRFEHLLKSEPPPLKRVRFNSGTKSDSIHF